MTSSWFQASVNEGASTADKCFYCGLENDASMSSHPASLKQIIVWPFTRLWNFEQEIALKWANKGFGTYLCKCFIVNERQIDTVFPDVIAVNMYETLQVFV